MHERVAVFIDNNSLYQALVQLGIQGLDYIRLKDWLLNQRQPTALRFYCGEVREDSRRRRPFYEVLERAGFEIVSIFQPKSREGNAAFDTNNCQKVHCRMAFDICECLTEAGAVVLVSGSSDLSRVVSRVREKGANVEVVFFEQLCSPALRRGASEFRKLKLDGLVRGGTSSHHSLGETRRDNIATRSL